MHREWHYKDMHILFVCWGTFAGRLRPRQHSGKVVKNEGLQGKTIDSAGTISSHQGNPPDSSMTAAARNRNLTIAGICKKVNGRRFY